MELDLVFTIAGIFLSAASFAWGVVKYLLGVIAAEVKSLEKRMHSMTDRKEFETHVERTDKQLHLIQSEMREIQASVNQSIQSLSNQLTSRLDNILLVMKRDK